VVVDYNDCCCADVYSDGEIKVLFQEASRIHGKTRAGGQSAERYARNRQIQITQWFKKINDYLSDVKTKFKIGISPIYQRRFFNTLSTRNKSYVSEIRNTEYSNLSGIYQFVNKLNAERGKVL